MNDSGAHTQLPSARSVPSILGAKESWGVGGWKVCNQRCGCEWFRKNPCPDFGEGCQDAVLLAAPPASWEQGAWEQSLAHDVRQGQQLPARLGWKFAWRSTCRSTPGIF